MLFKNLNFWSSSIFICGLVITVSLLFFTWPQESERVMLIPAKKIRISTEEHKGSAIRYYWEAYQNIIKEYPNNTFILSGHETGQLRLQTKINGVIHETLYDLGSFVFSMYKIKKIQIIGKSAVNKGTSIRIRLRTNLFGLGFTCILLTWGMIWIIMIHIPSQKKKE